MKRGLIVSGGPIDPEFAAAFLKDRNYDYVIAADAGFSACLRLGIRPDIAVGDFDTFGRDEILRCGKENGLSLEIHRAEKDESDTELALTVLERSGCTEADVLGATGGRLDHELSNIQLLLKAKKKGIAINIYDAKNRIRLIDSETEPETVFRREELFGQYVSFLPLTERVLGITLTGFRYPLTDRDISVLENPSLCLSNELLEDLAVLSFREGVLICVESHD